jgi:hypothetical protein
VQAHPTRPGCFFYAVSSGLVCVCDVRSEHARARACARRACSCKRMRSFGCRPQYPRGTWLMTPLRTPPPPPQDDPTHQVQLRGHDGEVTTFALSVSRPTAACVYALDLQSLLVLLLQLQDWPCFLASIRAAATQGGRTVAPMACVCPDARSWPDAPPQHSGALLASAQRGFNCDVLIWDTASLTLKHRCAAGWEVGGRESRGVTGHSKPRLRCAVLFRIRP